MTDFVTTATVKGVELVKAGTWQGLTGPVTLTREDLADALAASQDPEVDHAALKLGHIDPRFDGQPAAGWVERLRLSDDGQTLLGDLVDMPSKLAAIMPSAFRRRSAELRRNVVTPSGRRYRMALSGLALLGVQAPAVKGLADVLTHYASEGETPGHEDDATQAGVVSIMLGETEDTTGPVPHGGPATGDAGGMPPVEAGTDQREDGDMDPQMKAQLVAVLGLDAEATDEQVQAALTAQAENAATERENSNQTAGTDGGKLPAAGTESQTAPPAAGVRTTATTSADGATAAPVDGQTTEGQASLSDGGMVSIPRATFESMKAQLDDLVKAEQDRQTEAMLSDAMQAGKISPAEVAAWRANLSKPEARAGAAAMLSELPARYPVTMLGAGTTTTTTELDTSAWDAQADRLGL